MAGVRCLVLAHLLKKRESVAIFVYDLITQTLARKTEMAESNRWCVLCGETLGRVPMRVGSLLKARRAAFIGQCCWSQYQAVYYANRALIKLPLNKDGTRVPMLPNDFEPPDWWQDEERIEVSFEMVYKTRWDCSMSGAEPRQAA